jgi:hypothetical protein
MASSGMLRRVTLVRTEVSHELSASFIRVTRIGELGTSLALTSNRRTLRSSPILITLTKEVLSSSETSVLTRATRRSVRRLLVTASVVPSSLILEVGTMLCISLQLASVASYY